MTILTMFIKKLKDSCYFAITTLLLSALGKIDDIGPR